MRNDVGGAQYDSLQSNSASARASSRAGAESRRATKKWERRWDVRSGVAGVDESIIDAWFGVGRKDEAISYARSLKEGTLRTPGPVMGGEEAARRSRRSSARGTL